MSRKAEKLKALSDLFDWIEYDIYEIYCKVSGRDWVDENDPEFAVFDEAISELRIAIDTKKCLE